MLCSKNGPSPSFDWIILPKLTESLLPAGYCAGQKDGRRVERVQGY